MFDKALAAALCATISALMFMADIAWTPLLGIGFGLAALGIIVEIFELMEGSEKDAKEEVVVEKSEKGSFEPGNRYHDVHFDGRSGRDLVDPRERPLSEAELNKIIHNAQNALRKGRQVRADA